MTIYEKLFNVQQSLVAPKDQFNGFGKYKYRSCENILEALKPLLKENNLVLLLTDEVKYIGNRVYVEATAILFDTENGERISSTASAREEESKKGMDASQVTGASSSYARKYALSGLFAIDDNKDSDATNQGDKTSTSDSEHKTSKDTTRNREDAYRAKESAIQPVQAPDGKYYCSDCGEEIEQFKSKTGTITAKDFAVNTIARYGHQLCKDCAKRARDEGKTA